MNDSHTKSSFLSPQTIELTRWVAVGSLTALIFVGLAWELWLAPLRPGGSLWALKVVPLCWPLAGLLKNRMYTYRWVSLLVWLYFIEGVVRAWGDKGWSAGLAGAQTFLCVSLFGHAPSTFVGAFKWPRPMPSLNLLTLKYLQSRHHERLDRQFTPYLWRRQRSHT